MKQLWLTETIDTDDQMNQSWYHKKKGVRAACANGGKTKRNEVGNTLANHKPQ